MGAITMNEITTLYVFREADGSLSYKPAIKGARWRSGFDDMPDVSADADKAGVPSPREIDYLEEKKDA